MGSVVVQYDGPEAEAILSRSLSRWQAAIARAKSLTKLPELSFDLKGLLVRMPYVPDSLPSDVNWIEGFSTWKNSDMACPLRKRFERRRRVWIKKRYLTNCIISPSSNFCVWEDSANNGIALLVLAWAYVLSASLVERQGRAMKYTASGPPREDGSSTKLDLSYASQQERSWWSALVRDGQGWSTTSTYIVPWALSATDIGIVVAGDDIDLDQQRPPTAQEAASYISRFCHAYGLGNQSTAAFAAALSLPLHAVTSPLKPSTIELPKPNFRATAAVSVRDHHELPAEFSLIGYYMTLSLRSQAFASTCWSIFFEPDVPCNFAGAWIGPIAALLEPVLQENNLELLAKILSFTKAAPLWLGLALCGRGTILKAIVPTLVNLQDYYGQPDIDCSALTGTTQSFMDASQLQPRPSLRDGRASRADVWRLRHDCYTEYCDESFAYTPSYGWPPFGEMRLEDIEFEIRGHLTCSHRWTYGHWTWLPSGVKDTGFLKHSGNITYAYEPPDEQEWPALHDYEHLDGPCQNVNLVNVSEIATKAVFSWCKEQVEKGFGGTIVPRHDVPETPIDDKAKVPMDPKRIRKWLAALKFPR